MQALLRELPRQRLPRPQLNPCQRLPRPQLKTPLRAGCPGRTSYVTLTSCLEASSACPTTNVSFRSPEGRRARASVLGKGPLVQGSQRALARSTAQARPPPPPRTSQTAGTRRRARQANQREQR